MADNITLLRAFAIGQQVSDSSVENCGGAYEKSRVNCKRGD